MNNYKEVSVNNDLENRLKEAEKEYKEMFKPDKNGQVEIPF